ACCVTKQCVGGFSVAAHFGFVDDIVMQQCRGVNKFNDSCEIEMVLPGIAKRPCGQNNKCGAQSFAATVNNVFTDLSDKRYMRMQLVSDGYSHDAQALGNRAPATFY